MACSTEPSILRRFRWGAERERERHICICFYIQRLRGRTPRHVPQLLCAGAVCEVLGDTVASVARITRTKALLHLILNV